MSKAVKKIGNCILAEKPKRFRSDWKPSLEMMRLREIEKLIRARHGLVVPDPEDTDDRDTCLAYVKAAAFSFPAQDLTSWCRRWAPWVRGDELMGIEAQARKRRRMMTADGVAGLLSVSWAERTAIGLNTFGACDVSTAERRQLAKARKRDRDRARQERRRRKDGRVDRQSQRDKTLATLKPWEAEGISRRAWFYRMANCTRVSRVEEERDGDTLVQLDAEGGAATSLLSPSRPIADGIAGRRRGLGDNPPAEFQEAEPHGSGDTTSEEAA